MMCNMADDLATEKLINNHACSAMHQQSIAATHDDRISTPSVTPCMHPLTMMTSPSSNGRSLGSADSYVYNAR